MSWFKKLFGGSEAEPKPTPAPELSDVQRFAFEQAGNLMRIINESLQLSNNSTNPSTKVSRLELARSNLDSLVLLSEQHPFIKLQRLEGVRASIAGLSEEYSEAGYYALTDSSSRDYSQNVRRNIGMPIDDLTKGWRFGATMQLRTPLRVLSRHGEVHDGLTDPPPIAREQWEGYWTPVLKSFKDLGIDIPEIVVGGKTTASDIGQIPVDGGDYLKFLLAVRAIVERDEPVESRKALLSLELRREEWAGFCRKLGGKQAIQSLYFPAFIHCIPKLPRESVEALWSAELTTPVKIAATPDAALLAIKGIGPAKLKIIREACEAAVEKESELVDVVGR